jgi:hypothetical protein
MWENKDLTDLICDTVDWTYLAQDGLKLGSCKHANESPDK